MKKCQLELNKTLRVLSLGVLFSFGIASITATRHTDGGGGPRPTEPSCSTVYFQDDFEADTVDMTPSVAPAGNPVDDSLAFSSNAQNYVKVVSSSVVESQAVRIRRGSSSDVILYAVTGSAPQPAGTYYIRFRAYSVHETGLVPPMTINIESTSGKKAAELIVDNLQYELKTGNGSQVLSSGYTVNNADVIQFEIDMVNKDVSISIDNVVRASNQPFLETGFEDIRKLSFKYPPAILEAWGTYDVDDIKICLE